MHLGVRAAADAESLGVLVMSADGDWDRLPRLVREMQRLRVRGLVMSLPHLDLARDDTELREAMASFAATGGSVCTVGSTIDGFSSVTADEVGGSAQLATLVFGAGYRQVVDRRGVRSGPAWEKSAVLRREGLYHPHLREWSAARDAGALSGLAGKSVV